MPHGSSMVIIRGAGLIMVMADTVDPEITRVVLGLAAIPCHRPRRAVVAVVEQAVQSVSLRRTWKPAQVVIQQQFQGHIIRQQQLGLSRGHQRHIITMLPITCLITNVNTTAAAGGTIRQARLL
jgi:hypothetical protein